MASAKKVGTWFRDLRQGNAKKREAAAKQLAITDRASARETLLEVLETTKKAASRVVIARCLHYVADGDVARMIANNPSFELQPDKLPAEALRALYDDVRVSLPTQEPTEVRERLTKLGVLFVETSITQSIVTPTDSDSEWRDGLVATLRAIIADPRMATIATNAARAIRVLDTPRGNETLLALWQAEPLGPVRPLDAYAAWVRLGCQASPDAGRVTQLYEAIIEQLSQSGSEPDIASLDSLFAETVRHVPEDLVAKLTLVLGRQSWGLFKTKIEIAKRLVDITRGTTGLIALMEDGRYEAAHAFAAKALIDSGITGARAVLARGDRVSQEIVMAALNKLPPTETYDFIAPRITQQGWYDAVTRAKTALRDPRWVDLAVEVGAASDQGRRILVAIANDTRNSSRARAVAALAAAAASTTDRWEKRHVLYALGQTGHPNATTALVDALDDPAIGDAVPLVCTALGECGDTRAIAILEKRIKGPHSQFVSTAIQAIRERVTKIHHDVLLAACQDDDPVIADLATRARDGDTEAAIVLEDALRERGRL